MKRLKMLELQTWTEARVARAIIHSQMFNRQLLMVPRCHYAGAEADLLALDPRSMRLIDIEVKVSRADALADPKKDKWWSYHYTRPPLKLEWPRTVWKHYYCMPSAIWHKDRDGRLARELPRHSGVLLLYGDPGGQHHVGLARRAKPNPKAKPLDVADSLSIARLAGLRMWDALIALAEIRDECNQRDLAVHTRVVDESA
jgi:hypothetical protein